MKRKFLALLAALFTLANSANVFAATDIKLFINGEELVCDPPAIIENDRLLVPMRAIFEKLEAQVNWDAETRTITAAKNEFILLMQIGNPKMFINNDEIELDVPPSITDDRTMVPARAVSEAFDIPVEWNDETREVNINYQNEAN